MLIALSRVAKAPIRAEASDRSEIVSELLFGEEVEILERKENWARIRCQHDAYEGWMDFYQLIEKQSSDRKVVMIEKAFMPCESENGPLLLPMGSRLQKVDDQYFLEEMKLKFADNFSLSAQNQVDKMISAAQLLLNTPYLWGGRSSFGIDCSGFVQVCHSLVGITLSRDSSQQFIQGQNISNLAEARIGDLAFFKNKKDKIVHVGLLLSPSRIIHASSLVRIDQIDEKGIYNMEREKYTHHLAGIRRNIV